MSAEQDEAAVGSVTAEERAELARLADTGERNWWSLDEADDVLGTVRPDTIRRLLADLDAAENIARLAEESEAGWRREADELAERLAAVRALAGWRREADELAERLAAVRALAHPVTEQTQRDEATNLLRLVRAAIEAHRDLHKIYANTSACSGGIGGAAMTQHCGVTCGYGDRHEADNNRWYDVECAYFRRQDGDPEWADYLPGERLSTTPTPAAEVGRREESGR